MNVRLVSTATTGKTPFMVCPVVVQTAGTFTDTVDLTGDDIAADLSSAINDEFGFQFIGNPKTSTIRIITDDGGIEYHHVMELNFDIPSNVLALLNKEQNTERLQSLLIGLVGRYISASEAITVDCMYYIDFIIKSKGITIR
jgi:hypothetical protein